ncbi:MAG: PTS sugar transporter subunit IIA [Pseudomonadota bacterium]
MDVNIKLVPEAVSLDRLQTQSQVLTKLSEDFAEVYGLEQSDILEGLEQREALGSTGFGRGAAIPHCRSRMVRRPTVVVLKLAQAIDFGAVDATPVDLFFGLVSPENAGTTHLHALAAISRLLRDEAMVQALRDAPNGEAVFAVLTNQLLRDAA